MMREPDLIIIAKKIGAALESLGLKDSSCTENYRATETLTGGKYIIVYDKPNMNKLYFHIWFDSFLNEGDIEKKSLYFGIFSEKEEEIANLIQFISISVCEINSKNLGMRNGLCFLREKNDIDLKDKFIFENYGSNGFYLGKYPNYDNDDDFIDQAVEFFSLLSPVCGEDQLFSEGACRQATRSVYERNSLARKICIEFHRSTEGIISCNVCGFDFHQKYGDLGKDFIHIHHKTLLSSKPTMIDPKNDLIPVCPNCHAMIHAKNPPYTPEELMNLINKIE